MMTDEKAQPPAPIVSLADDGYVPEPAAMAARLHHLTESTNPKADYYGNGGAVAMFEQAIAAHLGKERAVMFPTGTLANLLAINRLTAGCGRRIIVHRQSHFFNDSGDNLALLGGFTMVPLEGEAAGFSAEQVATEIARAEDARVASAIGAIAVESPSRRLHDQRFRLSDIEAIATIAAEYDIPLFLDGARMLIECAYTGQRPVDMAAPFTLVYMSLYKYLGAPFGCILAGPAALLDEIFHERRRYGGSLYQMRPAAMLAQDRLESFADIWAELLPVSEAVIEALAAHEAIRIERIAEGTNIVLVSLRDRTIDADRLKAAAATQHLKLPPPIDNRLALKINETWRSLEPQELAERVATAMLDAALD